MDTTKKIYVLDNGFVSLLNLSGPTRRSWLEFDAQDVDPPNTARMSFDAMGTRTQEEDERLAKYLMKNWHTTPFEMVEVWLEMKLPIFVARQFVRHRTPGINEVSGRYVQLPADWYIPDIDSVMMQSADKKQGGKLVDMADPVQVNKARSYCDRLNKACSSSYSEYQQSIQEGIAMEQARLFLHVNHYTHWVWKQDLHNLMHFLSLRVHEHAQMEARVYAKAIITMLEQFLPKTMELFYEYRAR